LGSGPFDQFFDVMENIDFVAEARRRSIEVIVLFVADPEPETARTYAELRHRLKPTIFIPVHTVHEKPSLGQESDWNVRI
jgi:hypothetical protein